MLRKTLFISCAMLVGATLYAQDDMDMLDELGEDSNQTTYATASYKSSRIINSISLENTAEGVLDMRISHRFGAVNSGVNEFFWVR